MCDECHKSFLCFDLTSASLDAIVVTVGNKPYRTGERMTRKDYEKIAQVMSEVLNDNAEPSQWMGTVNSLAHMLKQDNPRFDKHTFRNACGWVTCTGLKSEQA